MTHSMQFFLLLLSLCLSCCIIINLLLNFKYSVLICYVNLVIFGNVFNFKSYAQIHAFAAKTISKIDVTSCCCIKKDLFGVGRFCWAMPSFLYKSAVLGS